jgi:hypothetical protein
VPAMPAMPALAPLAVLAPSLPNCCRLPSLLQGLFEAIPADEFRADISSTELRAAGR